MDITIVAVLTILVIVTIIGGILYRRGETNLLGRMFGIPPEATTGERKFVLTVYVLHRIWATAIVEFLVFIALRTAFPERFSAEEILSILKEVNYVFLLGTGGAVAIYTGGNIGEWKYRSASEKPPQE
jgi:preprotein translocase subunit SecG